MAFVLFAFMPPLPSTVGVICRARGGERWTGGPLRVACGFPMLRRWEAPRGRPSGRLSGEARWGRETGRRPETTLSSFSLAMPKHWTPTLPKTLHSPAAHARLEARFEEAERPIERDK